MAALVVTGIDEVAAALKTMAARVETATGEAVMVGQALIEGRARAELSRSSHQIGTPTPSAPGQPPSLITGVLRSSFRVTGPTPAGAGRWTSVMGPTTVYARIQELGGVTGRGHHTVLPPRPYLRPAYDALVHSDALRGVFTRAWARAITG